MLYDRLRVLVYDRVRPFERGDAVAITRLENLLGPMGCEYKGWESHPLGRTHLMLLNEPTVEQVARVLLFAYTSEKEHKLSLVMKREFIGRDTQSYCVDSIMRNVAEIFSEIMIRDRHTDKVALAWSDLKVLRAMIDHALEGSD